MPLADRVQMQFTVPASFAGTPTLTLPCGVSSSGVPYALQLLGSRFAQSMLCRIGHAYEEATVFMIGPTPVSENVRFQKISTTASGLFC